MRRPGHHRPLGSTARLRFPDWPRTTRPPMLGDVTYETDGPGGGDLRRYYEVVGVVELARGYRLLCERIAPGTLPGSGDPDAVWAHHRV
jgi:hypothetical protein